MAIIATEELKQWLSDRKDFVLLDVLGKEEYEAKHLPGAKNACIYEMTFLDQVDAGKETTIVVYGSGPTSLDAADAEDRLKRAGYTDVHHYDGGRVAWQAAGYPFEGKHAGEGYVPRPPHAPADGEYALDTDTSYIEWTGRNVGNRHYGTLRFRTGRVTIKEGTLAGGSLDLDMKSLEIGDLDGEMAQMLVQHLESDDFFAAIRFPTCVIEITSAQAIEGATPGLPNHRVQANVTLRGQINAISFLASVAPKGEGIALQTNFDMDRTLWGVNYGSGKLYEKLGMHLVNDHVTLQVCVHANRA